MITIPFFLTVGIGILACLFIVIAFAKQNFINRPGNDPFRWVYFACLSGLAVLAVLTVDSYVYPKKDTVFRNTDYHVIEHKGFITDSVFYLVHAQYPDHFDPDRALWDGKSGLVRFSPDSILVADFYEPFYVERKDPSYRKKDSLSHHKGNSFVLVNKIVSDDIFENGLTLTRGSDTLYRLQIVEGKKKVWYISSSSKSRPDTSQFTERINRGYPLSDIVAQSPHFDFNSDLQELLEGTLLVRESIPVTNEFGGESNDRNKSPLLLFPGSNLYDAADETQINGNVVQGRRFSVPYRGKTLFYSGIGRTKTDLYSLSFQEKDKTLEIRYVLPKMQKLKADGGQLFISSSVETILQDSKDGGYYYNIFDSETNHNQVNAEIRYLDGTAREGIEFEVMDVYSDYPSEKKLYKANDGKHTNEFFLSVKDKRSSKTKWIFDIKDLRASNPLQPRDIILFILVFVFLVGVRLLTDSFLVRRTLTILELSAYVVVLCLCVVRLILGWRASTFVPIEDISASMFAKMRSSIKGTTYLAWGLPIALTLLPLVGEWVRGTVQDLVRRGKDANEKRAGRHRNAQASRESASNKDIVILFLLTLIACFFLSRGPLVRLMNIPVPMISFLLFDWWVVKRETEQKTSFTTARAFLATLAFVYLFIKDAGFTIIFFVFLFLYHVVIGTLLEGTAVRVVLGNRLWNRMSKRNWSVYLICIALTVVLFFFLRYEGDLMIWVFSHIGYILLGMGATLTALFIISYAGREEEEHNHGLVRVIYGLAAGLLLIAGVCEVIPGSPHPVSDRVNKKVHMKYRAEVQKLRENETVDVLIEKSDFKSTDITYIMRSAHNQWFINQYLKAGQSLNGIPLRKDRRYMVLQPHSNQGSSYTTQTTDLVITRYVLAEHGNFVVVLFMLLFLFLLLGYIFEVRLKDREKREMLAPLLLLFSISLLVFLSATNRVVFVGQDFPFISLQSRVAILFPLALLYMAIRPVIIDKQTDQSEPEERTVGSRKWAIVLGMSIFAAVCVAFIPQQGKNQNEEQFDISKVISSLSEKVEVLDRSLMQYQRAHRNANLLQKDTLWRRYIADTDYSAPLRSILEDSTANNRFYRSLIEYFSTRQAVKNDPEELLHLRKRSSYWHLDLNKKHFFIRSMLDDGLQWSGDLLAAKTKRLFAFKWTRNGAERRLTSSNSYDKDLLPADIRVEVPNVHVSRFDASWTDLGEPLLLITSMTGNQSKPYFTIEASDETIKGPSNENQISTRIKEGDLVMVYKSDSQGDKEVLGWRYGRDNENFLAKNIWMNGRQKLFYPLGKESMWSYQFANAVSNALGKSEEYRDSTLRISIDYDLHNAFYDILTQKNRTRLPLRSSTVEKLQAFEVLPLKDMKDINNNSAFYYDADANLIRLKSGRMNGDIKLALDHINPLIAKADTDTDKEAQISAAVRSIIERKFDFSAVVLDGNGRIRLLFDHSRSRSLDPNNIRHFNKIMSDLYKNGDNRTERDIFGNKALQVLPSGPGSSFKPIAYTAITSAERIAWETLDVSREKMDVDLDFQARSEVQREGSRSIIYDYYGGIDLVKEGQPRMSIDNYSGYQHNNYLIRSNNLYHSAVILLGLQPHGKVDDILKTAGNDVFAFPVLFFKGKRMAFDPQKWYHQLDAENGVMNDGLYRNFRLQGDYVGINERYSNFFGDSLLFRQIFSHADNFRPWSYPETSSHNISDRNLEPKIMNGFNQILLGAYPLEVTPLQMATMGMRLATLNREPLLTTLDDQRDTPPEYSFFDVPDWEEEDYLRFYQRQVLAQLKEVPRIGTASGLAPFTEKLSRRGYHLYAKTGTLNDERDHVAQESRMKHLFVIISNTPLETVSSIEELKHVKYYVLYLSYIGVDVSEGFTNNDRFEDMISAVVDSELFHEYMEN